MEYRVKEALGLIETRGMVPAIQAADIMCKTADVALVSYENMGSGLVTVMVKGDVAAVRSSVEAGAAAAAAIGELTASHVIPRPIDRVGKIVARHDVDANAASNGLENKALAGKSDALGFIETYGLVSVVEAADAMCKAADVELVGYENVASGLISVVVRGDVGAVKAAVEAGLRAAGTVGKIYSSNIIARPHRDVEKIIAQYTLDW